MNSGNYRSIVMKMQFFESTIWFYTIMINSIHHTNLPSSCNDLFIGSNGIILINENDLYGGLEWSPRLTSG